MRYEPRDEKQPYGLQQKTLFMIRKNVGVFQEQIVLACATRIKRGSEDGTALVESLALIERRRVHLPKCTETGMGNERLERQGEESSLRPDPLSMTALDEIVAARVRRMRSRIDTWV